MTITNKKRLFSRIIYQNSMENTLPLSMTSLYVIGDIETKIGTCTGETRMRAIALLDQKMVPLFDVKKNLIQAEEKELGPWKDYMLQVLRVFAELVAIIDPQLQHITVFQRMYQDIIRSFYLDMKTLSSDSISDEDLRAAMREMISEFS